MHLSKYCVFFLVFIIAFSITNINFTQAAASEDPVINLTSPNGGGIYSVGDQVDITWTQSNVDMVTIGYKVCESCLDWIEYNMEVDINDSTGHYLWTIPEHLNTADYEIYIIGYHVGVGSISDTSDADFTINSLGVADPSNLPKADAYEAVVKIKTYTSDRYDSMSLVSQGSGIIFTSGGLVLTNYHVVTFEEKLDEYIRDTSYQICIPQSINQEPDCLHTAKMVARDKDLDMAILKIENISGLSSNSSYSYLDLNQADQAEVGDQVIALGYPAIGGDTVTITQGIISGKLNKYNKQWIKTDAVTSYGSSGGAAIDSSGKVIGIPSQAHSDLVGTLGYIIDILSVNDWINQNKNKTPETNGLQTRMIELIKKQNNLKKTNLLINTNPSFSITKVDDWDFAYEIENNIYIDKKSDDNGGVINLELIKYPRLTSTGDIIPMIKNQSAVAGILSLVSFNQGQDVIINGVSGKKITVSALGDMINVYGFPVENYLVLIGYDYGENDKDKIIVDQIINTFKINSPTQSFSEIKQFTNPNQPVFSFDAGSQWSILANNSRISPAYAYHKDIKEAFVDFNISKHSEDTRHLNSDELLDLFKQQVTEVNQLASQMDLKAEIEKSNSHYKLNDQVTEAIMVESIAKKISTEEILENSISFTVNFDDKYLTISLNFYGQDTDQYNIAKNDMIAMLQSFSLSTNPAAPPSGEDVSGIANRLKGKILLQVEDRGRIWYVNPGDSYRHEVTFANALPLFEKLALGISNENLYKILIDPSAVSAEVDTDQDGYSDRDEVNAGYNPEVASNPNHRGIDKVNVDNNLSDRLKGKLLLQVEDRGRIWYVDFNGKRWEVTWDNLMNLFQSLALGITNFDLNKIQTGTL